MEEVVRFEWALILLLVLGIAVFELVSLRRTIRRDRAKQASRPATD